MTLSLFFFLLSFFFLLTSRDPERLRSWPRYVWGRISRKRLKTETLLQWSICKNTIRGLEWSRDRWRHVTRCGRAEVAFSDCLSWFFFWKQLTQTLNEWVNRSATRQLNSPAAVGAKSHLRSVERRRQTLARIVSQLASALLTLATRRSVGASTRGLDSCDENNRTSQTNDGCLFLFIQNRTVVVYWSPPQPR